jgi:hypothetical protein
MGEASASQLKIWSFGLPTIVSKTGWYAGLSEDAVGFVNIETEIEDIQHHLENFLDHPDAFVEMGKNGFRILKKNHSPDLYARKIIDFAASIKETGLNRRVFHLTDKVGELMSIWINDQISDDLIRPIAAKIIKSFKNK